jgi:hypothetical protein
MEGGIALLSGLPRGNCCEKIAGGGEFVGANGVGHVGVAAEFNGGAHFLEDLLGFLDAGVRDVGVGVAGGQEDGDVFEGAGVIARGAWWADEAAGEGDDGAVGARMAGREFAGEAGALGEAKEGDFVGRDFLIEEGDDDGFDPCESGIKIGLVRGDGGEEGEGVPGVVGGLGGEGGEGGLGDFRIQREDVLGGGASAVDEDEGGTGVGGVGSGGEERSGGVRAHGGRIGSGT